MINLFGVDSILLEKRTSHKKVLRLKVGRPYGFLLISEVFKRVIGANDVKPFFELFLPEKNVLGITSVILKNGTQADN